MRIADGKFDPAPIVQVKQVDGDLVEVDEQEARPQRVVSRMTVGEADVGVISNRTATRSGKKSSL